MRLLSLALLYYVNDMIGRVNTRVAGSLLVGLGLVLLAFFMSRADAPGEASKTMYVTTDSPTREAITVGDKNRDGVEDWQEPFLTAAPVLLNTDSTTYERDNTLTEQVSISLMENIMTSESMGGAGISNDELVKQSTNRALNSIKDKVYTEREITIIPEVTPEIVRDYGNTIATIFSNNDVKGMRNELLILEDAVRTKDQKYFDQVLEKAQMFAKNRDMMLELPVPTTLAKEHLALINIFNVLSNDLKAMTEIEKDPLKSLLRLRGYEVNSSTLALAMQNMYFGLSKYPSAFSASDPALAFSMFADVQKR